jgi:assimilatory nitrate reductase catalytic subunit
LKLAAAKAEALLRQRDGPLTRELVQQPGKFGLGKVPARLKPDATTNVVCGFCSTGCGLNVHLRDGRAVNLTASADYPVNLGMACPKGWEALTPLSAPDRGTTPLLRNAAGKLEPVEWDAAMREFTARFKAIQARHGAESVAFISTGQMVTEEMALLGALAKFGMGMVHGDGNTRQCMATSVAAYKQSFGFDAPPFTYADFEESDVLVFVGSNLCIAHPILWQRVLRNPHRPEIVVVDPRKTETAMGATQHYALRPKSDLTLLYGLAHLLVSAGWVDRDYIEKHTTSFAEFADFVRQFTPDKVAAETGLTVGDLYRFAETIYRGKRVSFWWTMGVNQGHEATRTAQAIINLALMTGNIGRPGTGANSITGQCNAMGSRLFSNTTNLLGGHDFTNESHRAKIAGVLGLDATHIPDRNSLAYDQILQAVADDKIRGLWIIATNTAHSWIDQAEARRVLGKLDFLVVQDMYHTTETASQAHLYLPAAGWGEKEGTFINSERRIGLTKRVAQAPGKALSDFNIFKLAAHYWGCEELFREWQSPEAVFQIMKRLSREQPCDITGIEDYAHLDREGGIQWPLSETRSAEDGTQNGHAQSHSTFRVPHSSLTERRLFADGRFFHPDGRAKFLFDPPRAMPEPPDAEYPFLLLTGRGTSAQWHTQTRTAKSAILRQLYPATITVDINPDDARRLGVKDGERVQVESRRGELQATAVLTPTVQAGQIFIPMHYEETNRLTLSVVDPHSRQPSYKASAVRLGKAPGQMR